MSSFLLLTNYVVISFKKPDSVWFWFFLTGSYHFLEFSPMFRFWFNIILRFSLGWKTSKMFGNSLFYLSCSQVSTWFVLKAFETCLYIVPLWVKWRQLMHTCIAAGNFQRNLCICILAATLLPGLDVLRFTCLRQLEMHFTVFARY